MDEEKKKLMEVKWFTQEVIKRMILENLKQYVLLVISMEIILLI